MKKISICTYITGKQRVDMYLASIFQDLSRSYIQKLIDKGDVSVNGEKISKNIKINPQDEICIQFSTTSVDIVPENIPLDIVYEDENILIVNKNSGLNTHPTPGIEGKKGTLVNAILYHCKGKLPSINGEERPGIVHRLDKDTSGAIMIAKNDTMMKYLSQIIHDRKVGKYYIAIVTGIVSDRNIKIESYIGRHPTDKTRMTTKNPINPKNALTYGTVLGYIGEEFTVLKIKLETGRTHQIRVHLASIGYPIIGDSVYGNIDVNKQVARKYNLYRQALHAYELELDLYGEKKVFIAEYKQDMRNILDTINL